MENNMSGGQAPSPAYDYRLYDQVWQRVSPGIDPFSADPAAAGMSGEVQPPAPSVPAPPEAPPPAMPAPRQEGGGTLPGADPNPCCMGTDAQESLEVLEGFMQEELAGSRCCQALAARVRNRQAAQLLCRAASEKHAAARELCAAYFLITGTRYEPAVTLEHICWENLPKALRSFYHQEACNGLNYQRAAEETLDICLTKLLNRLSEQSYRRAEEMMSLLGKMVCC